MDKDIQAPVYDYDQAIQTTVDPDRPFFGKIAQMIIVFIGLMTLNSSNFIIMGLPFMKSEPSHFYCKSRDSSEWTSCTKKDICENGLSPDEYSSDKGDYNYIQNW